MATTKLRAIQCVHCGKQFSYVHEEPESPFYMNVGWLALCDCGGRTAVHGTIKKTNFEFSAVSGLDRGLYVNAEIESPRLRSVYRTFIRNMDQVIAFGRLPHLFKLHYESFLPVFQITDQRIIADSGLMVRSQIGLPIDPTVIDPDLKYVMCRGMRNGLAGLLSSMITGTWTAFETLSGDLWEAALNTAPTKLRSCPAGQTGSNGRPARAQPNSKIPSARPTPNKNLRKRPRKMPRRIERFLFAR